MQGLKGLSGVLMILLGVMLSLGSVRGNAGTMFEADGRAPVVKIEVPAHLNLGNVTPGFSSERVRVDIDNVGTTAVAVIPQLEDANEEIFKYLSFTRRTTEPYAKIGDFTFFLSRPSVPGKIESDYFYAKLDLSTFQGSVKEDVFGRQARVVFWVLPQ